MNTHADNQDVTQIGKSLLSELKFGLQKVCPWLVRIHDSKCSFKNQVVTDSRSSDG